MSKSRLEKFLYALYSLDSSDLPTPLSRIEELYKCLVTGEEAPTFKPLSRVEKYLMAILGLYDLETQVEQRVLCTENNDVIVDENENRICLDEVTSGGIPAPISRIEKLLYKLATGDDNLDDIKSFLSEHEELLAEIIRNWGVGGNIDIKYVLYSLSTEFNTLYNTSEKPVKSAILKGSTLVNLVPSNYSIDIQGITTAWGHSIFLYSPNKGNDYDIESLQSVKSNTKYLLRFYVEKNTVNNKFAVNNPSDDSVFSSYVGVNPGETGWFNFVLTSKEIVSEYIVIRFQNANTTNGDIKVNKIMLIEYQEGMENWDIPYFEGMQSVKMPVLTTVGKNLLPCKTIYNNSSFRGLTVNTENNRVRISGTATSACDIEFFNINTMSDDEYIKVKPNTKYILSAMLYSGSISGNLNLACKSITDDGTTRWLGSTFTTNSNESKVNRIRIAVPSGFVFNDAVISLQLEESTVAISYEPHKSNILTVNEPIELRGIGGVRDELNLLTGEVTERIGEIILDGSQSFNKYEDVDGFSTCGFYTTVPSNFKNHFITDNTILCDEIKVATYQQIQPNFSGLKDEEAICINSGYIKFRIDGSKATTAEELKAYLSSNPITLVVPLIENIIKTVDLSVVDQDGNDTELSTFNDITHITLSSEELIPEAELEVATKNEEVLNTMSLEMDDISTTQNDLQETLDTQSENVDSTMIATTEIYEGLL